MFSLQVQILGLSAYNNQQQFQNFPITIRFGPLQTNIFINGNSGGKRLVVDITEDQMNNLLKTYAFGLFIKNQMGKFWCILSLENVKIGQQYLSNGLVFYDDQRNVIFNFGLLIKILYFNPKVPKNNVFQEQNNVQVKPIIQTKQNNNKNINSFLDGRKNLQQTKKPAPPPQPPRQSQTSKKKQSKNKIEPQFTNPNPQYHQISNNSPSFQDYDDIGIYIPPVMEFTNQQQPQHVPLQIDHHNQQNLNQTTKPNQFTKIETLAYNQDNPYIPNNNTHKSSLQKQHKNEQQLNKKSPQPKINKQQLREMAHRQNEKQYKKYPHQLKIAIQNPKTKQYQLIPLSQLSQKQLITYIENKKKQSIQKQSSLQKIKIQQSKNGNYNTLNKNQKFKLIKSLQHQNIGINQKQLNKQKIKQKQQPKQTPSQTNQNIKKIQIDNKQHIKIKQKQKPSIDIQQDHGLSNQQHHQINQQQYYQSDFQSFSNAGSLLKSRKSPHSSLSNSKHQKKKRDNNQLDASQSQSVSDYGYSQDFDSFSQSMLSKNSKYKKQHGGSASQISGSLTSMSQRK